MTENFVMKPETRHGIMMLSDAHWSLWGPQAVLMIIKHTHAQGAGGAHHQEGEQKYTLQLCPVLDLR